MRVVSVPGRIVRHPVTNRVIDANGVNVDPFDVTFARLIADGDLAEADDEAPAASEAEGDSAADAGSQAAADPAAAPSGAATTTQE